MKKYIKSPLNYTGGKHKLLPQIEPLFPQEINRFFDIFAGGANVAINSNSSKVIVNDIEKHVIELYQYFQKKTSTEVVQEVEEIIKKYELSKENKEGFLKLRESYNEKKEPIKLYVLICFGFNHQIRFNNSGQFNIPFGKNRSHFSERLKSNLINFIDEIHKKQIIFSNSDFEFPINNFETNDFVYCDPPYLVSRASYNESDGWNEKEERRLLNYLDELHKNNIKFALSNVLENKGLKNEILIAWSKKYNVNYLNYTYKNSNYQRKNEGKTVEVLITNY